MTAKDDCYRLIQIIAITRDPVCIVPGCGRLSEVGHHLFKRDRMATAFHPDAVRGLCHNHHNFFHALPAKGSDIVRNLVGCEYCALWRLSWTIVQRVDYVAKRVELREILAGLKKKVVNA